MNSVMSSDVAADQGLVYNLRAQMLGQDEEGVGETAYNTYTLQHMMLHLNHQ